jgi:predicted metal-dependent phosphoesterase TrpH
MARKTTRLDLHVHTKGSDGWGSPDEIAAMAVERGLDGLVIADHHVTFSKEGDEVAEACRDAGLLVFRGCEYSAEDGHCLVLGLPIEPFHFKFYKPMQEVINEVRAAGGVVVPAHPFHGYRAKLGAGLLRLTGLAAVEARNGQCEVRSPWENEEAYRAAEGMVLQTTGGSDAHSPSYVGVCFTEFAGQVRTDQELVKALLTGRYRAVRNLRVVRSLQKLWALTPKKPVNATSYPSLRPVPTVQLSLDKIAGVRDFGPDGKPWDDSGWLYDRGGYSSADPATETDPDTGPDTGKLH